MNKKRILTWILIHIIIVILMTVYILLLSGHTYESGTCWDTWDKDNPGGCDLETKTSYPPTPVLFSWIAIPSAVIFLALFVGFEGGK